MYTGWSYWVFRGKVTTGSGLSLMPVSAAAQPLTADDTDLSPWWLRTVLIVLLMGFTVLIGITTLAYRNAPPIPVQVADAQGASLFSGGDISEGQTVFLKYGLMANGSIWGHGGYLGPDYSAIALHRIGEDTAAAIAQEHFRHAAGGAGACATGGRTRRNGGGAQNQPL